MSRNHIFFTGRSLTYETLKYKPFHHHIMQCTIKAACYQNRSLLNQFAPINFFVCPFECFWLIRMLLNKQVSNSIDKHFIHAIFLYRNTMEVHLFVEKM